jgi:two-component system, NarL family, nitrate/nitrite response regulator NarL
VNEQSEHDRIRLILLDNQALFRASLARLLASQPGLEVAAECGSSAEAMEALAGSPVDIVLLDFDHAVASNGDGGFIAAARRHGYQGRFLIVAEAADARISALAIKLGAAGIFLKSEVPDRLVQALRLVANGAVWFDQKVIQLLADQLVGPLPHSDIRPSGNPLSERERKVLMGIVGGLTNRKIGENLGLSEGAVKASVQQLFLKTGVRTRSQLVRAALEGSLGSTKTLMRRMQRTSAAFHTQPSGVRLIAGDLSELHQPND